MDKRKLKDGWVRCESKSHKGRFYLFNKETGETQWLKRDDETKEKKRDTPPLRLSINKVSKTPAQDRLKRLQHSLKSHQKTQSTSNTKPKKLKEQENELDKAPATSALSSSVPKSTKKATKKSHGASFPSEKTKQENELDEAPSTSALSSSVPKSTKKATKRSHGASFPSEKADLFKCAKSSEESNLKNLTLPDLSLENFKNAENEHLGNGIYEDDSSKKLVNKNLQNMERNNSRLTNICSGIVKKIKDICKIPFNVSKKIADEKSVSNIDESFGLKDTAKFKTSSKTKSKQILSTSVRKELIVNQIKEESNNSPENRLFTRPFSKSTPKTLNIPSYPQGSANSRLERLKQSLLSQQANSTKCSSVTSIASETNNSSTVSSSVRQKDHQLNSNESIYTADKAKNDEVEAMDWQPTTQEESESDAIAFKPTPVVRKSSKLLLTAAHDDENQTMGDIIDRVNENLLRIAAEKQKGSDKNNKKWRKDFYYFVVDTNVFLRDLTFIDDLTKMQLSDTKGSLLFVPYSVLQELDKLKMCSGPREGVKTLAVRAIKYLNAKLASNSLHVQAQSALEERLHLIAVESADDSIINCCLQVKKNIPNFLFLSEDVNLRNKAISNNIMVSTKSDLLAKRYDFPDIP